MIQFTLETKALLNAIKHLKTQIKVKKKLLYEECTIFVEPTSSCIRILGAEYYMKYDNYKKCSFRMYFYDFIQLIESLIKEGYTYKLDFILTEKQLQVNNRKISILSATINENDIKSYKEIPLDMINQSDDNNKRVLTEVGPEKYCLLTDVNKVFYKSKVSKDILTCHAVLGKYNVTFKEIEDIVKSKMYEIDNKLLF